MLTTTFFSFPNIWFIHEKSYLSTESAPFNSRVLQSNGKFKVIAQYYSRAEMEQGSINVLINKRGLIILEAVSASQYFWQKCAPLKVNISHCLEKQNNIMFYPQHLKFQTQLSCSPFTVLGFCWLTTLWVLDQDQLCLQVLILESFDIHVSGGRIWPIP